MEVLLKRPLAVKEEKKVDFNGDVNGDLIKEQLLESARAEMGEVKQENEKLKTILSRITKDYQSLQTQFMAIAQQQQHRHQQQEHDQVKPLILTDNNYMIIDDEEYETELLSLSLGTIKNTKTVTTVNHKVGEKKNRETGSGDLSLGLQCSSKLEGSTSSDHSFDDDQKEEDGPRGEQWQPSKVSLKNPRSTDDLEVSPQVHVKKARVSVRARCDAPTMNDGCQWRKYGQKISKGNPCPRAYYRCTVAPQCPVRKQVQRCAEDMSILVTTYEGTHNHPLSLAATTIASTTSAAASMLLSPSSSSTPTSTLATNLNFTLSQPMKPPLPFHHLSASPSHPPTITLDLTTPSPQFSTSSLNLSPYPSLVGGYLNKHTNDLYNNNNNNTSLNFTSYLPKSIDLQQEALTDSLAKAITSDPSFKSALASAITSIVGSEGSGQAHNAPPAISSGMLHHLNKPVLTTEKFGYLQSSSSLGFLNGKSSSTMENRDRLNL